MSKRKPARTDVVHLYVLCSFPKGLHTVASSDTCRAPADTAVKDGYTGNLLWRCPQHRGWVIQNVPGKVYRSVIVPSKEKQVADSTPVDLDP